MGFEFSAKQRGRGTHATFVLPIAQPMFVVLLTLGYNLLSSFKKFTGCAAKVFAKGSDKG